MLRFTVADPPTDMVWTVVEGVIVKSGPRTWTVKAIAWLAALLAATTVTT